MSSGARHLARLARRVLRVTGGSATVPPALPPRLGYVVHGRGGVHPGSAHVRVVRRVNREVVDGRMSAVPLDASDVAAGRADLDLDVVLVQRDAVPPDAVAGFVQEVSSSRARLVVEVDDDFFTPAARTRLAEAEYDPARLRSVRALVDAADLVVVSTDVLGDVLRREGRPVVVLPNQLDAEFWAPVARGADGRARSGAVRVLYMGTSTHAHDLAVLRPVFDGLVTRDGRRVLLDVVGVTESGSDWYTVVPTPETHYPEFVRWLRSRADTWSVGVAPLVDDTFNRAKSDLKFLEYTMLGLPTVCSRVGPYLAAGEHGARLASTTEEWRAALLAAVEEGLPRRSVEHVEGERLLGKGVPWTDVVLGRRAADEEQEHAPLVG